MGKPIITDNFVGTLNQELDEKMVASTGEDATNETVDSTDGLIKKLQEPGNTSISSH